MYTYRNNKTLEYIYIYVFMYVYACICTLIYICIYVYVYAYFFIYHTYVLRKQFSYLRFVFFLTYFLLANAKMINNGKMRREKT